MVSQAEEFGHSEERELGFLLAHSVLHLCGFDHMGYRGDVLFKNLREFAAAASSNAEFVHKYLTLTKCDLFFADKAILVEGASERILLPNMIDKCNEAEANKLKSQYYSIIEVGGAYAHRFIPFMQFIDIPCLIITGIDPEHREEKPDKNGNTRCTWTACSVNNGTRSSNATINNWVRNKKGIASDVEVAFEDIKTLSAEDKEDERIRLAFQIQEQNLCGRSLEEAIRNSNRSLFGLPEDATEEIADNLKKEGAYIPGISPGTPTAEYLDTTMTRVTFGGAVFLMALALFPVGPE